VRVVGTRGECTEAEHGVNRVLIGLSEVVGRAGVGFVGSFGGRQERVHRWRKLKRVSNSCMPAV